MVVSALYGDRDGVRTNMYGQRNWHIAHPLCRSVADRLIRIMVMLFPAPCGVKSILAGNRTFVNFCLQKNVRMMFPVFRTTGTRGHFANKTLSLREGGTP